MYIFPSLRYGAAMGFINIFAALPQSTKSVNNFDPQRVG